MQPPPMKNDCFAMPPGVDWTPVDQALAALRQAVSVVVGQETVATHLAGGRVLAADVVARRGNPPQANSAVDGYGFAFDALSGAELETLPLVDGRAAAGQAFGGAVPAGSAIRILTGAVLPDGVDTVVLEEDTTVGAGKVMFRRGIKRNANTRKAGEDFGAGEVILPQGRWLTPADLGLASAAGIGDLPVFSRLRVGVLSTGAEVVPVGETAEPDKIYDANRPMLRDILRRWGFDPVDLGHVGDDADALQARLDDAAGRVDAILTSGGASAGDEDHVSAVLGSHGTLHTWRIAVKPGRPLAMAMWQGVPVFGLPGNPVAAFVCTLVFGYPALSKMAGAGWQDRRGFVLPAAFSKKKKAGRREFLRARLNAEGLVEAFRSEGSGRIAGLSWATGLVELPDGAMDIAEGEPVLFLPYNSFGL